MLGTLLSSHHELVCLRAKSLVYSTPETLDELHSREMTRYRSQAASDTCRHILRLCRGSAPANPSHAHSHHASHHNNVHCVLQASVVELCQKHKIGFLCAERQLFYPIFLKLESLLLTKLSSSDRDLLLQMALHLALSTGSLKYALWTVRFLVTLARSQRNPEVGLSVALTRLNRYCRGRVTDTLKQRNEREKQRKKTILKHPMLHSVSSASRNAKSRLSPHSPTHEKNSNFKVRASFAVSYILNN